MKRKLKRRSITTWSINQDNYEWESNLYDFSDNTLYDTEVMEWINISNI